MSRYGDEGVQALEWVYGALTTLQPLADAAGVALEALPGLVWPDPAPEGVDAPWWVVYSVAESIDARAMGGQPRIFTTVPLDVKVVGPTRDYGLLAPAARAIYALHGTRNAPISGGGVILTVQRTGGIQYPEQAGGIQYRHLGHTLQVEVQ